ncbi:DUF3164 family protein [Vibrio mediterranei]|uniref:DUF3164 family protein n=1 Tax=Vibrio mediterranei TaxID=689 RepID=UPI001EFE7E78|nr:DUF3164 family protein [Vibrio mediterranei]MCG9624612.1 DUF3164 family protein [Vibrio mediterranei]
MTDIAVPEGYLRDRKQRLIPLEQVPAHDLEMNDFVLATVAKAYEMQEQLREFKAAAFGDCHAFLDLLAEKHERKLGGEKGNVTFSSYDGTKQVQISVQDSIVFGPELQVAKDIIDECLHEWSEGANANLKAIVTDAFEIDKEGNLNTGRILSLRRISIDDERWQQAMKAIADSILVASTKPYIRFKERGDAKKMVNISLDIAAL